MKWILPSLLLLFCCGRSGDKQPDSNDPPIAESPSSDAVLGERFSLPIRVSSRDAGFGLSQADSFIMKLAACKSGLTAQPLTESVPFVDVYLGDRNCLVQLLEFTIAGDRFVVSRNDGFSGWLPGETATFINPNNRKMKRRVQITSQLSSPTQQSDRVQYLFAEIEAGDSTTIPIDENKAQHDLIVAGFPAPKMTIQGSQFQGVDENGAGLFVFTMACDILVQAEAGIQMCDQVEMTSIKYRLIEDTYEGILTLENANAIFLENTTSVQESNLLDPGDGVPTGGFITETVKGPPTMHTRPNMIFVIQGSNLSYRYFNVDVSVISP